MRSLIFKSLVLVISISSSGYASVRDPFSYYDSPRFVCAGIGSIDSGTFFAHLYCDGVSHCVRLHESVAGYTVTALTATSITLKDSSVNTHTLILTS